MLASLPLGLAEPERTAAAVATADSIDLPSGPEDGEQDDEEEDDAAPPYVDTASDVRLRRAAVEEEDDEPKEPEVDADSGERTLSKRRQSRGRARGGRGRVRGSTRKMASVPHAPVDVGDGSIQRTANEAEEAVQVLAPSQSLQSPPPTVTAASQRLTLTAEARRRYSQFAESQGWLYNSLSPALLAFCRVRIVLSVGGRCALCRNAGGKRGPRETKVSGIARKTCETVVP